MNTYRIDFYDGAFSPVYVLRTYKKFASEADARAWAIKARNENEKLRGTFPEVNLSKP